MNLKVVLTIVGILITIVAPLPYIRDTLKGKTKPHSVTWLIWSILVSTAFLIQLENGGGLGSLVLGFTALMNIVIFCLSLRYRRDIITKFDLIILTLALLTMIPWRVTNNKLLAVILVTCIQFFGYLPTFRKSLKSPNQETISLYSLSTIKQAVGIGALSSYNIYTLLFPTVLFFTNTFMSGLLIVKRKIVD